MNEFGIGSTWHSWDMHIHTPFTKINNHFSEGLKIDEEWKKYVNSLNDSSVEAFGITDYGSFKNYIYLKHHRNELGLRKDIYIFPNLELRVSGLTPKVTQNGKSAHSKVNLHILLSDKVSDEDLNKILANITVVGSHGKQLDFYNDFNDIVAGGMFKHVPTYMCVLDALKSVFGETSEEYLIMLPNTGDGIDSNNGTGDEDDINFINEFVDLIQSSSKQDRTFFLNEKGVQYPFDKQFPCVTGSDVHDFEKLSKLKSLKHTWVKSTLNFEGLRSIKYEPKERVKVQTNSPDDKISSKQVKSLTLPKDDFNKQEIIFNRDLVSIIGSRSSGKSLLLSILAKTMGYKGKVKLNNTDYEKLVNGYYSYCNSIYYDGGLPDTNTSNVDLLYQNQLQSIAMSQQRVNTFIEEVLNPEQRINKSKLDGDLKQREHELDDLIQKLIEAKLDFDETYLEINKLQTEEKINHNITEIKKKIKALDIHYDQKRVNKLKKEEEESAEQAEVLRNENETIRELSKKLINPIPKDYKINNELKNQINEIIIEFSNKINKVVQDHINNNDVCIEKLMLTVKNINKDKDMQLFNDCLDNLPQLKEFNQKLNDERTKFIRLHKLKQLISDQRKRIVSIWNTIKKRLSTKYDDKKLFQTTSLEINYKLSFNTPFIISWINQCFKTSSKAYKSIASDVMGDLEDSFILQSEEEQIANVCSFIYNLLYVDGTFNGFRSGKNFDVFLNGLKDNKLFKQDFIVKYNGMDFNKMSEGKKAFVLLLIKLQVEKNDMPLLIDQPEDELDNKSIVNDLVSLLRNQKKKRQIILVTHNANIVIGADSDQVIIATEKDQTNDQEAKFVYRGGALDDEKIKTDICNILEGGRQAFAKRENRYGF